MTRVMSSLQRGAFAEGCCQFEQLGDGRLGIEMGHPPEEIRGAVVAQKIALRIGHLRQPVRHNQHGVALCKVDSRLLVLGSRERAERVRSAA